ncbi:LAFA_0A04896g1_1 [Lachancea sp. 'fantastica']|nr:LAFA_0A04896g1_1 [Lachancea sp. 'fantastica']
MSDLLPLATYNLKVEPYSPTPAVDVTVPVTVRITLAAVDPDAVDDEEKPSTLRIIKRNPDFDDDEDDILGGDFNEDELDDESEEEEQQPEEQQPAKKSKKSKKQQEAEKQQEEEEQEEEEEDDEDEEDDEEFQEYVVLTLSPKVQFQQTLDLVIAPEEEVQFVLTGSYPIYLTGNYVKHPFDQPRYGDDSEEDSEGDDEDYDSEEYDLTPDEDEILDDLEDASDVEGRIEEIIKQEEDQKANKDKTASNNKRKKQEDEEEETQAASESPKETKKAKKDKKEKKVEFKKDLEEGPSKKATKDEKPKTKVLEGGVIVEDRVVGKGKAAKKGSKVGMRYIGKLKNGKVFDKNTSGKPFNFNLGRGEVIKGWDIGVAGMAVGGERRIVIPAPYAYGKQALPGLPANSELTFDVKLVSMK